MLWLFGWTKVPDDFGHLDELMGVRWHHPRPADWPLRGILFVLVTLGTFYDAGRSMWPPEGMVWYGAFVGRVSVEEGMAEICRKQGGIAGRTERLATCVDPLGGLLWTVNIGPRKP
jgi:hypothetical protein